MQRDFSGQDAPKARMRANAGAAGRNAQPPGEDLGEGKPETDSQNLGFGRLALEGLRKGQEDLDRMVQHADPVGGTADE